MHQTDTLLLPEMTAVWQQTLNWQPTEQQQTQFQRLYELILVGNRQLNLTRITAPLDFWEKHLWDSLRGIAPLLMHRQAAELVNCSGVKVIDIGTGAGFPGLPVAIIQPSWNVTLLDSTHKKITFLDGVIAQLGMENVKSAIARAEILAQQPQHQQAYDIALIRAVGSAPVCAKYALPYLKPNGLAVLYRGNWTTTDTAALASNIAPLGGVIKTIEEFTTPLSQSIRHCLYLKKVAVKS